MVKVRVQISGDKELIKKLDRAKIKDFKSEFKTLATFLIEYQRNKVFETEGSIFGFSWKSLKPSYDFAKRKKYPGRGILEKSGVMRRNWRKDISSKTLVIENLSDYAIYHQSTAPRSRLPRRPLVNVDNKLNESVNALFSEEITKRLRRIFS